MACHGTTWVSHTRTLLCKVLTSDSGFFNGIIAYGVSFIHSHLESWRVLFLIEGSATVLIAVIAMIVLPDDIPTCRWLSAEEKDYCMTYSSCFPY